MRATANPPVLAAYDVFGDRLRAHLEDLAGILLQTAPRLQRRFLQRLKRLGYDPRQRKALAAITPGAAVLLLRSRQRRNDFIEQVEYNGRRLAKLKLPPSRIVRALGEYDRLLTPVAGSSEPTPRSTLKGALEQWYFCVILTLNNAFYQVAASETQVYHELFRNELESRSLDELLARMLESLSRFSAAEAGALYLLDPAGSLWSRRAATRRGQPRQSFGEPFRTPASTLRRLQTAGCAICVKRQRRLGLALDPNWQKRFRTCWSVPLAVAGRMTGVVQFGFAKPYEWLPREEEVLAAAAERCVLAAEKARLVQDLAAREKQVRELAARMLGVEERERRRISSELHDEAGQSLLCIRLQLEMMERTLPEAGRHLQAGLSEARAQTERTIVEIRRLISALSPVVLERRGLAAALQQLTAGLRRWHKMQVTLHVGLRRELPADIGVALYRLAQECLNNVRQHSSAAHVKISLVPADGRVRLCVEDDGIGFRVEKALAQPGSFGLAGMGERVALLGGEFHVRSQPGQGTRVLIELPVASGRGSKLREVE